MACCCFIDNHFRVFHFDLRHECWATISKHWTQADGHVGGWYVNAKHRSLQEQATRNIQSEHFIHNSKFKTVKKEYSLGVFFVSSSFLLSSHFIGRSFESVYSIENQKSKFNCVRQSSLHKPPLWTWSRLSLSLSQSSNSFWHVDILFRMDAVLFALFCVLWLDKFIL